jgi:hypothetical protein
VKHLLLFAARGGSGDTLDEAVVVEAQRAAATAGLQAVAMRQVPDDPFAMAVPGMRPFDATIELRGDDDAAVRAAIAGVDDRLGALIHADLSAALAGVDHVEIACTPTPVRYQYVMRRKIATTHEQYLDHYVHNHARFGHVTPGIEGYTQFHVDASSSSAAAAAAGFGVWRADSVSELHLESVEKFMTGLATSNPAEGAAEDEERFVDRRNSVMFTSVVLWRTEQV